MDTLHKRHISEVLSCIHNMKTGGTSIERGWRLAIRKVADELGVYVETPVPGPLNLMSTTPEHYDG